MLFILQCQHDHEHCPWRVMHLATARVPGILKSTSLRWPPLLLLPFPLMSRRSTGKLAMRPRTSERRQALSSSFEVKPSRMPSALCSDFIATWDILHLPRLVELLEARGASDAILAGREDISLLRLCKVQEACSSRSGCHAQEHTVQ